jgi:hypothetical protein
LCADTWKGRVRDRVRRSILHDGGPGQRPLASSASPYAYFLRYLHGEEENTCMSCEEEDTCIYSAILACQGLSPHS